MLTAAPAIQFAKLSGFSLIITTASLRNAEYLKSLGATHVIDRNAPAEALAASVAQIAGKPVKYAYDAVAERTQKLMHKDASLASGVH